jgi:hypothetical protein
LERRNRVKAATAAASITGEADCLKNVAFTIETKRERVVMGFLKQDKKTVFEPNRVAIERRDGTAVSRDDPSFQKQRPSTSWDDMHVAYFSEEALYIYGDTPFLCTYDGFSSEEILWTARPGAV